MNIIIKKISGELLFTHDVEDNTIKKTVEAMLLHFKEKWIENADLSNVDLSGIAFDNAKFDNATFDNAKFDNAKFDNATFDNATFYNATFYNATFYNAKFYNATFDNATFDNAKFDNAKFDNATFDNATFDNATFDNATFNDETIKNIKANNQLKMFDYFKNDFWVKLLKLANEIPAFKEKINAGKIDGSAYEGECSCFCGTFATIKNVHHTKLPGIKADASSPVEKWFAMISPGQTPENSEIVKLTMEWIEEFEMYLSMIKK